MDFLVSFPWPETAIGAGVGFVLGFLAGGRWGGPSQGRSLT